MEEGLEVQFGGCSWLMHSDHTLHQPDTQTLVLADLHIGKIAHFRRAGVAVPAAARMETQDRLLRSIEVHQPKRIVIAGDLFHSAANKDTEYFIEALVAPHQHIEWIWVPGNHDEATTRMYAPFFQRTATEFEIAGVRIVHESVNAETPTISGHIHPVVYLSHKGRLKTKHRCFVLEGNNLLLPAYGAFTGGYRITPRSSGRYFITTERAVYEL